MDSRNIVPCRWISGKQEYSAYTLRTKIERVLPAFLTVFPPPEDLSGLYVPSEKTAPVDWPEVDSGGLRINPGYSEGMRRLESFIDTGLAEYDQKRNDPTLDAQSGLSPWLHLGQISAQTAALRAASVLGGLPLKGGFLDELIVRRELSDNFCLYNPDYDRFEGFPGWARHSLSVHAADRREFLYGLDELERRRHMSLSGMRHRTRCWKPALCTVICGCTGPRRSLNGRRIRLLPCGALFFSMINTPSTELILTAMPAVPGLSEASMTGPGPSGCFRKDTLYERERLPP